MKKYEFISLPIIIVIVVILVGVGVGINSYINKQSEVYRDYLPEELRDFDAPTIYINKTYGYQITHPKYFEVKSRGGFTTLDVSFNASHRLNIIVSLAGEKCYEGREALDDVINESGIEFKQFYHQDARYESYSYRTKREELCYGVLGTIYHDENEPNPTLIEGAKGIMYELLNSFKFVEITAEIYDIEGFNYYLDDGQLVKYDKDGNKGIVIESIKDKAGDLLYSMYGLRKLSFPEKGNKLFFSVETGGGSDGAILYDLEREEFTEMKVSKALDNFYSGFDYASYYFRESGALSPDGFKTLSLVSENGRYSDKTLYLVDLELDRVTLLVALTDDNESFVQEEVHGGLITSIKWLDNDTIEYDVFNPHEHRSSYETRTPIERRVIKISEIVNINKETPKNLEGWETYTNVNLGYQISYPSDFNFHISSDMTSVRISFPSNSFPNTNFNSGYLDISADTVLTNCGAFNQAYGEVNNFNINGIDFSWVKIVDSAAGTRYNGEGYGAIRNDICYEILLVVGFGNIDIYDSSLGITEFDEVQAFNTLRDILHTFKFID